MELTPRAYWLIGPPGCGKSTWVKKHLADATRTTVVISSDAKVEEWAAANDLTYTEAMEQKDWSKEYAAVVNLREIDNGLAATFFASIRSGHDIIVDMTNMYRLFMHRNLPPYYSAHGVFFKISGGLLSERLRQRQEETGKYIPAWVIHDMLSHYVPPKPEDFNEILIVEQD